MDFRMRFVAQCNLALTREETFQHERYKQTPIKHTHYLIQCSRKKQRFSENVHTILQKLLNEMDQKFVYHITKQKRCKSPGWNPHTTLSCLTFSKHTNLKHLKVAHSACYSENQQPAPRSHVMGCVHPRCRVT